MKVFDSHMHWRDPVNNIYEMLSDGVFGEGERGGTAPATYLPDDYSNDAAGVEIVGAIHVEAEWDKTDPVGETRWLEALHAGGGARGLQMGIVGFTDLSAPDAEAILEAHADYPNVRGIRQMLNYMPGKPAYCWADREYLDDPQWRRNFGRVAKYGLDFDLMCFAHQMPAMARLASENPDTRIHLEHTGMPWDHTPEGRALWRDGLKRIAALGNSDIKISGLGNTIPNWTVERIRPYVLEAIDIFGTGRVSFASNFPTDGQFGSMTGIWRAFSTITEGFDAASREKMFVHNAIQAYGLDPSAGREHGGLRP